MGLCCVASTPTALALPGCSVDDSTEGQLLRRSRLASGMVARAKVERGIKGTKRPYPLLVGLGARFVSGACHARAVSASLSGRPGPSIGESL